MAYIVSIPGEGEQAERFVDFYATREQVDITFHEKHAKRFATSWEAEGFAFLAAAETGSTSEVVEIDRFGWRVTNALQRSTVNDMHAGEQ